MSLSRAAASIENVSGEAGRIALAEFAGRFEIMEGSFKGGAEFANELLEKAFGAERASEINESLSASADTGAFAFLKGVNPEHIVNFLQGEHPQAIALVLSFLNPVLAGMLLAEFPHNIQADVAERIACMKNVSSVVTNDIARVLERKFSMIGGGDYVRSGGIDTIVEMLNNTDRGTEKIIIEALEEENPELAEEVKKRMFVFEDIVFLDDRSVQKVLREVDTQDLAKALKGTTSEVQEKVFRNMSKRASSLLSEDMDFMGPIRLADVEEAQQKIINIIRKLEDSGEIIVARGGEEELVV